MTSPTPLTDEQLCEALTRRQAGDEAYAEATRSFDELYRRYARWLLSYLVSRVKKCDLEDVAQVIWQRVWERAETSFRGGRFQVWLFFIAKNYLIDRSRRAKVDLLSSADSTLADKRDTRPEAGMEEAERNQQLASGLERLPKQTAEIVTRRLDGESYEEICRKLSIPKSRAYKLLQQARQALTDWMAEPTGSAYAM
ncbi:MAG: RNA polymerase sigma factor [Planctomycetaceae bacterium]|nr:RNA polymerase sigma factor [Planctomycetaceae bacterium]